MRGKGADVASGLRREARCARANEWCGDVKRRQTDRREDQRREQSGSSASSDSGRGTVKEKDADYTDT